MTARSRRWRWPTAAAPATDEPATDEPSSDEPSSARPSSARPGSDEPRTDVVRSVRAGAERESPPPTPPAGPSPGRGPSGAPAWLRVTVAVLGVLLAAGVVGLVLDEVRPSVFDPLRAKPAADGTPAAGGRSGRGGSPTSSSTSTTAAPAPGGGGAKPLVSALQPSSGPAGVRIAVVGSGFFSADGNVVVTFGGVRTSTACPTRGRCVATVPPRTDGASSVVVRVQTATGTSNGVAFHYR